MVHGLKNFSSVFNNTLHSCEYHLLHDYPKSLRQSEPSSIAAKYQLTVAQCKAAARLLRFIADFDPQDAATIQAIEKWEEFAGI
jgi:hypothetical protein